MHHSYILYNIQMKHYKFIIKHNKRFIFSGEEFSLKDKTNCLILTINIITIIVFNKKLK
jgi:hypothetical protein